MLWCSAPLSTNLDRYGKKAFLRADTLGEDSVGRICTVRQQLTGASHAEAVFVELPLADPGTPAVALGLEAHGFSFLGIGPHFSVRGDVLRMVYLIDALAREPIKTYEDFGAELVDYAIAEQARVRAIRG